MKSLRVEYPKARRHLSRRDPVLKKLIQTVGPCTLQHNDDHFTVLVRSIVSQQISTKAAKSISAKLEDVLQPKGICAESILKASEEELRSAGLSTAKRRSLKDLAEKVHAGEVQFKDIADREDEEVIAHLLPVRGIGRWTAEMFLIFGLGRLDVLPVADLGLRVGVQRQYELEERPEVEELIKIAESWQPYRTIATWYIWRSFGAVPQS